MTNQLWVKIENSAVTQCWDTPFPENEAGMWREAIEVRPEIIPNRQGYTAHAFDLTKTPVEIVWGVYDIPVEDRKAGLIANANFSVSQLLQGMAQDPSTFDPAAIEAEKALVQGKIDAINAATTHDELDAL